MTVEKNEIEQLRQRKSTTLRATVPAVEALLYKPKKILDHGFIRVIDYMGDDAAIVQAARVSYGTGTKKVNADKGLINYLMRHRHTTPFEMCEMKFHIKLPIFIARQWIRHRTASVNEYSARYSIMSREFYIPEREHLAAQSQSNHQGRATESLSPEEATKVLQILTEDSLRNYDHYSEMLGDGESSGVARELARMNLTLNYYTEWYWKVNLHNLLNFISLRADSHAQYEIRVYADAMLAIVAQWVPHSYAAFLSHRMNGANFSAEELALIKKLVNHHVKFDEVTQETSGLSAREWLEFQAKIL